MAIKMGTVVKLRELIINNYGCIGNSGLSVGIDNIVVLIGPKDVGKTTVLKAYEVFTNPYKVMKLEDFHENFVESQIEITGIFLQKSRI